MEDSSGGDATKVPDDEFITLLKKLDLYKYYPDKLTRDDVFGLVNEELDDRRIEKTEELCKFFLHRLSSCNYKARDLEVMTEETNIILESERTRQSIRKLFGSRSNQSPPNLVLSASHDTEANAIHPLDVIVSIFLCSDPILKQDIANLLWKCKLAIPFITNTHIDDIPIAHVWPLMSICEKWTYNKNGKCIVEEDNVLSPCFLTIGFIRFQSDSVHKSNVINAVMSDTDSIHPIFYHRDAIGSTRRRMIANGMVEISWYLPNGSKDNMCHEPVTILNLRGNAAKYPRQLQVLVEMVSICFIVCPSEDLTDENNQNIVEAIRNKNKLVVIVTDSDDDTKGMPVVRVENNVLILKTKLLTKAKLKEHIKSFLKEQEKNNSITRTSIENFMWVDILVDQNHKEIKDGLKQTDLIMKLLLQEEKENRKNKFLPLHQRLWKNWVEADKEIHRLKKIPKNTSIDTYRKDKETEKSDIRDQQAQILQNERSEVIMSFLHALSIKERVTRIVCVRWLRTQLDKSFRLELQQLLDEETKVQEKIKSIKDQADENKCKEFLENLQDMKNTIHIGIEHLFREVGQIYEAIQEQTPEKRYKLGYDLPLLAAQFLLDGHSLEMFDGDVGSVPIIWVSAVFKRVSGLVTELSGIKDPKCTVLTVYGMQSSGKSTLLNTMFGCQFSVSAGRCTRGAQVQMLKVTDGDHKRMSVDYILLIDTEGVRSPYIQEDVRKLRDNEITTFVVGLGDKTIINLMGENTSYLTEVLPITARAFLRMNSVGIHPSCAIVYQNVGSQSDTQLSSQNKKLQEELDSQTRIACEMETKDEKRFNEVIEFDVDNDIHYIPSLWEGEQPMSPIAHGYSKGTSRLKSSFKKFCKQSKSHGLCEYSSHIQSLWTAISKDDFVYFFRNILETEARERLDKFWCRVVWDLRMKARQCESEMHTDIMNSPDHKTLEDIGKESPFRIRKQVTCHFETQKEKLKNFFKTTTPKYQQYMIQWETSNIDGLSNIKEDIIGDLKAEIKCLQRLKNFQLTVAKEVTKIRERIKDDIAAFFKEKGKIPDISQGNLMSKDEIRKNFDTEWNGWLEDVKQVCGEQEEQTTNINREAIDIMREKFPSHEALVIQKSDIFLSGKMYEFKLSEAHLIKKSEEVSGKIKIEFQQIVENAMEKVRQRLHKLRNNPSRYAKGSFEEIIEIVSDIGVKIEKYGVCTTKEFEIEMAMTAASMAVPVFTESEKAFFDSFDPINILEKEKESFFILFGIHYEKTSFTRLLAKRVSKLLVDIIEDKVHLHIVEKAASIMLTDRFFFQFSCKQAFLYTILIKLAKEGLFGGFLNYLENPTKTIQNWLGIYFDRYASLEEDYSSSEEDDTSPKEQKPKEKKPNLSDLISSMVASYRNDIIDALRDTTQQLIKGKQAKKKNNTINVKVHHWADEFTLRAESKRFIVDTIRNLSNMFVKESVDLEYFSSELLEQVEAKPTKESADHEYFSSELLVQNKAKQTKLDDLTTPGTTSYNNTRQNVVDLIHNELIGCTAACPFCAEICVCSRREHTGEHVSLIHRPQGCTGYRAVLDRTLVVESCPQLVANPEQRFVNDDTNGKYVLYKDYRTIYDQWNIIGDPHPRVLTFWEWFFVTYIEDLEKTHYAIRPTIPEAWKKHTKQSAIETLRDLLRTPSTEQITST